MPTRTQSVRRGSGQPGQWVITDPVVFPCDPQTLAYGSATWTGFALAHEDGRLVLWNGSQTPRLFVQPSAAAKSLTGPQRVVPVTVTVGK